MTVQQSTTANLEKRERSPLPLLIAQAFFSGLSLALLYTVANTMFLGDYGSEKLPYVYIAIAIVVTLTSIGFAELQKRWSVSKLAAVTPTVFIAIFLAAWLVVVFSEVRWMSYVLMVGFTLMASLGSIVLGNQANRLFDVRQMKSLFPLVLAGQTFAVIISGLSVTPLVNLLGEPIDLMFVAAGATLIQLVFTFITARVYSEKLGQSPTLENKKNRPNKSLIQLLRKRFVALIFIYQFLSSSGTDLVNFIFINRIDAQFKDPDALASFFGNFMAGATLLTLLFLLLAAGRLLNKFGLSFGLMANPGAVTIFIITMTVVGIIIGPGAVFFFWLAVSSRILDFILTIGTTNTATKATYQALPDNERDIVQTAVTGIGIPLSTGFAGLSLLIIGAFPKLTIIHVVVYALIICFLWMVSSFFVYKDFADSLLKNLSRRNIREADLTLEDASSLVVIERLVRSSKIAEVRLALDMLEKAAHPTLGDRLVDILAQSDPEIQVEALKRVEVLKLDSALAVVQSVLEQTSIPEVKGAALRAFCALTDMDIVEVAGEFLDSSEPEIRVSATVGLLRYGGIPGVLAAGQAIEALKHSPDPNQRTLLARVIGDVGVRNFFQPLISLLGDEDDDVRLAALNAAEMVPHPRILTNVVPNLAYAKTRSAASAALAASGATILPIVDKALKGETDYDEDTVIRLVRVCGQIPGSAGGQAILLLKQHIDHPDDDIQNQVLTTLSRMDYRSTSSEIDSISSTLRGEVEHGLRILITKQDISSDDALKPLHSLLDYEFTQARKRVFFLLSYIYDKHAILRAEEMLAYGDRGQKALAIETLDVTISSDLKNLIFPLIDDSKSPESRINQISKEFDLSSKEQSGRLQEIIIDKKVWSHGWTRASAIYAAAKMDLIDLVDSIEDALAIPENPIRETAAWALHKLAPDKYQPHAVKLAADSNPRVAQLAAYLTEQMK